MNRLELFSKRSPWPRFFWLILFWLMCGFGMLGATPLEGGAIQTGMADRPSEGRRNPDAPLSPDKPRASPPLARIRLPQRIAVLVGVQELQASGQLEPLRYPVRDVVRLYRALSDPLLGHFTELYVLVERSSLEALRAEEPALAEPIDAIIELESLDVPHLLTPTRANLLTVLSQLTTMREDEVLVSISTHGAVVGGVAQGLRVPPERMVYVLGDTRLDGDGNLIQPVTQAEVQQRLDRQKAGRTQLWESTCHNGWSSLRARGQPLSGRALSSRRTLLLADSAPGQVALEDDDLRAGVFVHFMLEALEAPQDPLLLQALDGDQDRAISVEEAFAHAEQSTRRYSLKRGQSVPQTPLRNDVQTGSQARWILSGHPVEGEAASPVLSLGLQDTLVLQGEGNPQLKSRSITIGAETHTVTSQAQPMGRERVTVPIPRGFQSLSLVDVDLQGEATEHTLRVFVPAGQHVSTPEVLQRLAERSSFSVSSGILTLGGMPGWSGAGLELALEHTEVAEAHDTWSLSLGGTLLLGTDGGCKAVSCTEGLTSRLWTQETLLGLGVGVGLRTRVRGLGDGIFDRSSLQAFVLARAGVLRAAWLQEMPLGEGLSALESIRVTGPDAHIALGIAGRSPLQVLWNPQEGKSLRALEPGWISLTLQVGATIQAEPVLWTAATRTVLEEVRWKVQPRAGLLAGWRLRF